MCIKWDQKWLTENNIFRSNNKILMNKLNLRGMYGTMAEGQGLSGMLAGQGGTGIVTGQRGRGMVWGHGETGMLAGQGGTGMLAGQSGRFVLHSKRSYIYY